MIAHRPRFVLPLPGGRVLSLGDRTLIMGIVNVTPDSFAGGATDPRAAIELALRTEADGADLVDIGGESTRPGAAPVSADDEIARIRPVLDGLAGRLTIPISIDTSKSVVARAAIAGGAAVINDVTGLCADPALAAVAADAGTPLILMHMRGTPQTMNGEALYHDLVGEVIEELRRSIAGARAAGVPDTSIVVDPGIGFAKRPEHSYGVLAALPALAEALGRPVLVGASRKSFLRAAVGDVPPDERDWASAGAVAAAILGGAHIIRVHAVKEMMHVARVADRIREAGSSTQHPAPSTRHPSANPQPPNPSPQ